MTETQRRPHHLLGAGYTRRMWRYFRTMLPIPSRLVYSALIYLAIAFFSASVHGGEMALVSWTTALGVWNVFASILLLRLMDELKDRDIDEELFPDRPLPAGEVRESDIRWSIAAVSIACVAANAFAIQTLVMAVVVLGFSYLMFFHFFAKAALRRDLLLTLATHEPIVPLTILQAFAVTSVALRLEPEEMRWDIIAPFVLMFWLAFLAWEICRKIRAPGQETEYVTYSRVLGIRGSVAFAWGVQTAAIGIGVFLHAALSLSAVYVIVLLASLAVVSCAYVRFLHRPIPTHAVLQVYAQNFLLVLAALQVLEFGVLT
jgi:hypothetical protein